MDASRAGLSSAASSSGRGCQHAAARPNGRSPASWRRCHQRRRGASCLVVTAAPSPSASSSPSPSSSSSSPEPQPLLPNWPHTPGARRMPQRMRRRGTGTALLSSSSLSTTPATTTSENAGDSSNLIGVETRFVAETLLPTRLGKFRLRGYLHTVDGGETYSEPSAVMTGTPEGLEDVPLRVHDACFTSEVLGSLKCDCAEQLQLALAHIQAEGTGIVIYLQQEGRGIGLANKIAAYALQEMNGLDTVDANRALGLPDDCREYSSVATILSGLGVRSVRLMTNNPRKVRLLQELGVRVSGRIPCLVQAQEFSARYLQTKGEKMDHIFGSSASVEVAEGSSSSSSSPRAAAAAPAAAAAAASFPEGAISPTAISDAAAKVSLEQQDLLSRGPLSSDDMDGSFCEWDHGGGGVIEAAAGGDGTLTAAAAAVVSSSTSSAAVAAAAAAAPPSSSSASSSSSSASSSGPSSTVQPLHGRMSRRQSPLMRPKRSGGGGGGDKGGGK